jgi:hypothetical protein
MLSAGRAGNIESRIKHEMSSPEIVYRFKAISSIFAIPKQSPVKSLAPRSPLPQLIADLRLQIADFWSNTISQLPVPRIGDGGVKNYEK